MSDSVMMVGRVSYRRIDGVWHGRYTDGPPAPWTRVSMVDADYQTDLLDEIERLGAENEAGVRCCKGCPDCLGIGAHSQIAALTADRDRWKLTAHNIADTIGGAWSTVRTALWLAGVATTDDGVASEGGSDGAR